MKIHFQHTHANMTPWEAIVPASVRCAAVLAVVVGGLALSSSVYAAAPELSSPPQNTAAQAPTMSPQVRMQQVETRIKTLHQKLGITSEQEAKWGDVAQTMRDNEAQIGKLVQTRHQNPEGMTAIDDLQSYADITQAHADGMKKLIAAFQPLYTDMPEAQKKEADEVFGRFEGHRGEKIAKQHR